MRLRHPITILLLLLPGAIAPRPGSAEPALPPLTGTAAFGDWRSDAPGRIRLIRPADLPAPFASRSASNGPQRAPLPARPALRVPEGYTVALWADGLEAPRQLKTAPNGDIFAAETAAGRIRVLRPDASGAAGIQSVFAADLEGPFGMAFYPPGDDPRWLYVATTAAVWRFPYRRGDLEAAAKPARVLDLAISDGGHSTRDIVFSLDGRRR